MGMLTMNIDQAFAHFPQLLDRGRRAVDIGPRAPPGVDDAAQQQFVATRKIVGIQPGTNQRQCPDRKTRRNFRPIATATDNARFCALAEHQSQCIDQNGFAGAGLAGERTKPSRELKIQVIDDDKIANGDLPQHTGQCPLGRSLQCSFWRNMAK